jgi:hypothetical protein
MTSTDLVPKLATFRVPQLLCTIDTVENDMVNGAVS